MEVGEEEDNVDPKVRMNIIMIKLHILQQLWFSVPIFSTRVEVSFCCLPACSQPLCRQVSSSLQYDTPVACPPHVGKVLNERTNYALVNEISVALSYLWLKLERAFATKLLLTAGPRCGIVVADGDDDYDIEMRHFLCDLEVGTELS